MSNYMGKLQFLNLQGIRYSQFQLLYTVILTNKASTSETKNKYFCFAGSQNSNSPYRDMNL